MVSEKPRTVPRRPTDAMSTPPITPGAATAAIACIRANCTKSPILIGSPNIYATATEVTVSLIVEPHM